MRAAKASLDRWGMNHVQRRCLTDHYPQPLEPVRQKPRRFINVVDRCVAHLRGNRPVAAQWPGRRGRALSGSLPS